jgi:hypothetical protein
MRFLPLFLILELSGSLAGAARVPTPHCVQRLGNFSLYVPTTPRQGVAAAAKVVIYPIYVPGRWVFYTLPRLALRMSRRGAERIGLMKPAPPSPDVQRERGWRQEVLPAFIYGTLMLGNLTPAELASSNFLTDTRALFDPGASKDTQGLTVGVNGIPPTGTKDPVFDFVSGASLADGVHFFHRRVSGIEDWLQSLKAIRAQHGPIQRLVLLGAGGSPGRIPIGEEHFDLAWVTEHPEIMNSLPEDLFADNAEILLLACHTAAQYPGEGSRAALASAFQQVARNGATLHASTQFVMGDPLSVPSEWSPLQPYLQTRLELEAGYALVSILGSYEWLRGDETTRENRILRIPVAPMGRK